jgi:REP element-mobilizing transposase RayT
MSDDRRLIEDFLPIQAISAEASREKSVRKGHISTLHLWWARRPLVACRAALYGALVPASRFIPENGPDNKKQSLGRANAAKFMEALCKYPGIPHYIEQAKKHILEAHAERLTRESGTGGPPVTVEDIEEGRAPRPKVLDMFAGGGAIPLEALRLGCEAYALDLNPVAHIIQLCTLVYPQKYGKPDPNVRGMTGPKNAKGETTWGGLADEVRYWGEWVLKKVKAEIGDLYPLIPDPDKKERGRTGVPPVIQGELFQTRRHLPHWQIGSSVYFITFSTRRIELPEVCRQTILDACHFWDGKKIRLHLICVMPDHVHALIEPLEESPGVYHDLSKVLHSIKSFTAHEINKMMGNSGPLWEEESWDRIIRDEKEYEEKWNYILGNPVKAGLTDSPERYPSLYTRSTGEMI